MQIKMAKTGRGFAVAAFSDRYGKECTIQKSSLATEDCIWFGLDNVEAKCLHGDAAKLGIDTGATEGWVPYPIPKEVCIPTRMHLNEEQVAALIPILLYFVDHGELP